MAAAMQAQNGMVMVGGVGGELITKLIKQVTLKIRMTIRIFLEVKGKPIFLEFGRAMRKSDVRFRLQEVVCFIFFLAVEERLRPERVKSTFTFKNLIFIIEIFWCLFHV